MELTIRQALQAEIHYPISDDLVTAIMIKRGLVDGLFSMQVSTSDEYRGALADCLYSLITAINFSEADKSIGSLTNEDKTRILGRANRLYRLLGEEEKSDGEPKVFVGDCLL